MDYSQHPDLQDLLGWYLEKVRTFNFTAHRTKERFWTYNIVDSIVPVSFEWFPTLQGKKVLDIGTGGGFPVVPLALLHPDAEYFCIDSVAKKVALVQDAAKHYNLPLTALHGRFEDYGQSTEYREQFDVVLSKAVAPWPVLLEYALPFVKPGGVFCAYQGPAVLESLESSTSLIATLGAELMSHHNYDLDGDERVMVLIKKLSPSPTQYPRKAGVPKKQPLLP